MRCSLAMYGLLSVVSYAVTIPVYADEPQWERLPANEQQILAPLGKEWNHSNDTMRKRWRHLAQRYPSLSPQAQERVRDRLEKWASLTPEARADARKHFKHINKTIPENQTKTMKWENYQHLKATERNSSSDVMIK